MDPKNRYQTPVSDGMERQYRENRRILIAGVGNIFLGDDGFGVEVAHHLASRPLPREAQAVDFGIRGFDLAHALLENPELVILVDTAQRGLAPGTVSVIEPDSSFTDPSPQTHAMVPTRAMDLARSMGATFRNLRVVTCEPLTFGDPLIGHEGLSDPVAAAVNEAVMIVESLVNDFLNIACTNSR